MSILDTVANFEGAPVTQPYMPGPTSGYIEPYHRGVDIGLQAGDPVKLPAGGYYDYADSSPYVSVFKLANGLYEGVAHIVAKVFKPGEYVTSGSVIGSVSSEVGSVNYSSFGSGLQEAYSSTAPHVHIDEYTTGKGAALDYGSSVSPYGLFGMGNQRLASSPGDVLGGIGSQVGGIIRGIGDTIGGIDKAGGQLLHGPGTPDPMKGGADVGSALQGNPLPILGDLGLSIPKDIGTRIVFIVVALVLIVAGAIMIRGS